MRMSRGFSMDTLRPHEYDIPLDRGGHLEGPHVFGFLINAFLGFWEGFSHSFQPIVTNGASGLWEKTSQNPKKAFIN